MTEELLAKVNNPIDTDPDPSPKPGARRLRHYWTRGPGAAKIRWGVAGDFNRCVRQLRKYVSDPKGLCNVYHRSALAGNAPGQGPHVGGKDFPIELIEVISFAESLKTMDLSDIIKINEQIDYDEEETKDNNMPDLEHKNLSVSGGVTETTEDGIVEALVSVTGVLDNVGDIIEPGAYEKTLKKRTAKGAWSHDWATPVSKTLAMEEWRPGDDRLPKTLPTGEVWPADSGALYVKAQFNLETQRGREAFSDVKFFGDQTEWSIGYKVPKDGATKDADGVRRIKELDLFEFSPVLFGAASNARSLISTAKSLYDSEEAFMAEVKSIVGQEPGGEPITQPEGAEEPPKENELPGEEPIVIEIQEPNIEEVRDQAKQIPLTADTLAELKSLYDQLGTVLSLINVKTIETVPVVDQMFTSTENKGLRDAMNDVIDGAYDSGVVEAIDNSIIALEGAIKAMDAKAIRDNANEALDEITLALQDERADEQTKQDLRVLVAAIGEALKQSETPNVPNTEEVIEDSPKTITLSTAEWKALLSE